MRIALDYDHTYTADPILWNAFIRAAKQQGHDIRCVTARSATEDRTQGLVDIEERLPVIYTNGIAKENICLYLDWLPDVWIDDKVRNILNNSPSSPTDVAEWRTNRNEGPSYPKDVYHER